MKRFTDPNGDKTEAESIQQWRAKLMPYNPGSATGDGINGDGAIIRNRSQTDERWRRSVRGPPSLLPLPPTPTSHEKRNSLPLTLLSFFSGRPPASSIKGGRNGVTATLMISLGKKTLATAQSIEGYVVKLAPVCLAASFD